jgi:putative transposase
MARLPRFVITQDQGVRLVDGPEMTLEALREATNKAWVMGSERFKVRMSKQMDRPVQSSGHGGDRKSKAYRGD